MFKCNYVNGSNQNLLNRAHFMSTYKMQNYQRTSNQITQYLLLITGNCTTISENCALHSIIKHMNI